MPMFIIHGLFNTPSSVLYGSKNRLKTCERFVLLNPRIAMWGVWLTVILPFYRMRRLLSIAFHIKASFYMKCNTGLEWVKWLLNIPIMPCIHKIVKHENSCNYCWKIFKVCLTILWILRVKAIFKVWFLEINI